MECYAWPYKYVVFYFHGMGNNKAYRVSLKGNDGMKVEALAMYHLNMAKWN